VTEKIEMIAEDKEGNWIEKHEDEDLTFYVVYIADNMICVSMESKSFDALRKLFQKLEDSHPM